TSGAPRSGRPSRVNRGRVSRLPPTCRWGRERIPGGPGSSLLLLLEWADVDHGCRVNGLRRGRASRGRRRGDRKSTRLNSSHVSISYAVFCLKKKNFISCFCTSGHIYVTCH